MKDMIVAGGGGILKQDNRGRVRVFKARREELLDGFERSSLSAPRFAALSGVKYQTLAYWIQKRKQQRQTSSAGTPSQWVNWLEAVTASKQDSADGQPLRLQLPGGAWLEVANETQATLAASVVCALASRVSASHTATNGFPVSFQDR